MNFGRNDLAVIIAMSIAIMGMSFTMPALGLSDENASEAPQFDMDSSRFDFAGEFPENPGTPSSGTLTWQDSLEGDSDNQVFLEGDSYNGVELVASVPATDPTVRLNNWDSGSNVYNTSVSRTTPGVETLIIPISSASDWKIEVEFTEFEGSSPDYNFTVEYNVKQRPDSDGGFISSIPVVGGLFSAGAELAGIVGWIGAVVWWFVTFLFQISLNLIGLLFDVMVFGISTISWLTNTYIGLINNAQSWAAIVLTIPSLILSFELAKLVMIAISLLPTT
jgi:hypothetical protein